MGKPLKASTFQTLKQDAPIPHNIPYFLPSRVLCEAALLPLPVKTIPLRSCQAKSSCCLDPHSFCCPESSGAASQPVRLLPMTGACHPSMQPPQDTYSQHGRCKTQQQTCRKSQSNFPSLGDKSQDCIFKLEKLCPP